MKTREKIDFFSSKKPDFEANQSEFSSDNGVEILEKDLEEESIPENEAKELKKSLEKVELPLAEVAKIDYGAIRQAFEDYKNSEDPDKQNVWRKVLSNLKRIREKRYDPFSYWSLTSETGFLNLIDIKKRKQLLVDLKERGFEKLDEVDVRGISVEKIEKRKVEKEKLGDYEFIPIEQANVLTVCGKIQINSFLLTEQVEDFDWKAEVWLEDDVYSRLFNEGDPLAEVYYYIDFSKKGFYPVQEALPEAFNSMQETSNDKVKKYNLDKKIFTRGVNGHLVEHSIKTDIQYEVTNKLKHILEYYVKEYVKPKQFEDPVTLKEQFEIQSEISTKTEEEIDEMFKQGLQTGEFDSMLLYVGEGAKKFLEITAGEDYRIMNKEFLLIRDNIEKIASSLEDSHIYELGPGNGKKSREILKKVIELQKKEGLDTNVYYTPIDINPMMIYFTARELIDLEGVKVRGQVCDFRKVREKVDQEKKNSFLLLGNTLGNGDIEYQIDLLKSIKQAMHPGEKLIVGVQVKSDLEKVLSSYQNEEAEKFVKLMLKRFGIEQDETTYKVLADEKNNQLLMTLTFNKDKEVNYKDVYKIFKAGESITITVSHKYEDVEIEKIVQESGLKIVSKMENDKKDYLLVELEK